MRPRFVTVDETGLPLKDKDAQRRSLHGLEGKLVRVKLIAQKEDHLVTRDIPEDPRGKIPDLFLTYGVPTSYVEAGYTQYLVYVQPFCHRNRTGKDGQDVNSYVARFVNGERALQGSKNVIIPSTAILHGVNRTRVPQTDIHRLPDLSDIQGVFSPKIHQSLYVYLERDRVVATIMRVQRTPLTRNAEGFSYGLNLHLSHHRHYSSVEKAIHQFFRRNSFAYDTDLRVVIHDTSIAKSSVRQAIRSLGKMPIILRPTDNPA